MKKGERIQTKRLCLGGAPTEREADPGEASHLRPRLLEAQVSLLRAIIHQAICDLSLSPTPKLRQYIASAYRFLMEIEPAPSPSPFAQYPAYKPYISFAVACDAIRACTGDQAFWPNKLRARLAGPLKHAERVLATKPSRAPRIVAINGSRRTRRPRS